MIPCPLHRQAFQELLEARSARLMTARLAVSLSWVPAKLQGTLNSGIRRFVWLTLV
jgi:hypothetical protein